MEEFYDDSGSESGCYYPEDLNDDSNNENYAPAKQF
jgi:hypothetical protein